MSKPEVNEWGAWVRLAARVPMSCRSDERLAAAAMSAAFGADMAIGLRMARWFDRHHEVAMEVVRHERRVR